MYNPSFTGIISVKKRRSTGRSWTAKSSRMSKDIPVNRVEIWRRLPSLPIAAIRDGETMTIM
jgi:hypothetical protein